MSMRPLSLRTLLTTLFRLSSSVTSRTIYQKRSERPSWESQLRWSHPFDLFVRKTVHRLLPPCSRVDLASRGCEFLTSSGLCQPSSSAFFMLVRRPTVQIQFHPSNSQ